MSSAGWGATVNADLLWIEDAERPREAVKFSGFCDFISTVGIFIKQKSFATVFFLG